MYAKLGELTGAIEKRTLAGTAADGVVGIGRVTEAECPACCVNGLQSRMEKETCVCPLQVIKAQDPSVLVLVDNCYGEFTEELEPTAVGAGEECWLKPRLLCPVLLTSGQASCRPSTVG
jgi:hypothetical protein